MKTYQEYVTEWENSTESRDLSLVEWLMLQLDRKDQHIEREFCVLRKGNICSFTESECRSPLCLRGKLRTKEALSSLEPPLGVKPRFIHNKERIEDITNAMLRMLSCNTEIYVEWNEELRDLIPEYNAHIKSLKIKSTK